MFVIYVYISHIFFLFYVFRYFVNVYIYIDAQVAICIQYKLYIYIDIYRMYII